MPEVPRPNIIWFIDDQHRAQAAGYMGDPNLATPNLDRLAQEGINFTQAVSGFPLCCPYRGSMLTGRYPHHCVPGHEYQLPPMSCASPVIILPISANGTWTGSRREMAGLPCTSSLLKGGVGSSAGLRTKTTTARGIAGKNGNIIFTQFVYMQ